MDFSKSIFENTRERPLVCAHRGVSGANIPCNSLPAFEAALAQGADMIELDVSRSSDGEFFVFHPGMEGPHLGIEGSLSDLSARETEKLRFINQDDTPTDCGICRLRDILTFLRGKCYINVDKFWTDMEGISRVIRETGTEEQVIVKAAGDDEDIAGLKEYARDLMFMPVIRDRDTITSRLRSEGINCVGAEVLFDSEDAPVCSEKYIEDMHSRGMVVWANAIVYDYGQILTAGHNDDISVTGSQDEGWGWLIDRKFDIIQTDWCLMLRNYMEGSR